MVGGRLLPLVVVLFVLYRQPMLARGKLVLLVLVGKEMVVLLLGVLSQLLVLVGDRSLPPVLMGRGLPLVLMQLMVSLLVLLLMLLLVQLPGLARAHLLLLLLVSKNIRLVVGTLVVLMHVLVLVGDQVLPVLVGGVLQVVGVRMMMMLMHL
jgi:hypothetical protein